MYYSHSGHTKLLAEAIGAGARNGQTMVKIQPTNETSGADLLSADAIIIGSPTYFGSQASNFSAWIETTWTPFWQHGNLSTKKGAVFTTQRIFLRVRRAPSGLPEPTASHRKFSSAHLRTPVLRRAQRRAAGSCAAAAAHGAPAFGGKLPGEGC